MKRSYNVLFLCTGNRSRSILAEAILRQRGMPDFTAYSAGSRPHGEVHPVALQELRRAGISTEALRSKSWDEFAKPDAPKMDFVFTLCDDAAKEACPVWPGQPMTAHWGLPDPGYEEPAKLEHAFHEAFVTIDRRIGLFLKLPLANFDGAAIKRQLDEIEKA